ncbi:MAG: M6 family metalloprotease domain-containing protein [Bacteroidales bacterium]|nr:M6 family metalloprotease domain-containing protein [Bacteroidales bacterium]
MKKIIFLVVWFGMSVAAKAVPAYPGLIRFVQPQNGDTISIYLRGDEKVHWAETEDGYSLLHDSDGSLVYAVLNERGDMVPSTTLATDVRGRDFKAASLLAATKKGLRYSKRQVAAMRGLWDDMSKMKRPAKNMSDVVGEKRFLVILFAFQDKAFTHTAEEFNMLFNQVNYTSGSYIGSVHDYYYEVSQGLFSLNVDIVGPFTGSQPMAHYGNTSNGSQDMAEEAVDSAARLVDFSNYDNDNDGYIDGLHIIFAGFGQEATGNEDEIWSHKWNIFSSPEYNNTVVNVYSCSPECGGNGMQGMQLTAIGVICHELGHVFGSPDYYDVDYDASGGQYPGLGNWDIMSGGSWNRNGYCPAQHNPYTKAYIYHWIKCDTLDAPQQVVMKSADVSNVDFHRINTSSPDDFFLLENRQRNRWDMVVPGSGLLVYHVNALGGVVQQSGNASHPMEIYILANATDTLPSGTPYSYGTPNNSTATFPGTARRSNLNDYTTPSLRPWTNAQDGQSLSYIQENTRNQRIYFCFGNAQPHPISLEAEGVSNSDVRLDWEGYGSAQTLILFNTENAFGIPTANNVPGDVLDGGATVLYKGHGNHHIHDDLEAATTYYYRIYNIMDDSVLIGPLSASATTMPCAATMWRHATISQTNLPDCWTNGDKLYAAPFSSNEGEPNRHFVLTLKVLPPTSSDDTLTVWLKNSIDSNWSVCYATRIAAGNAVNTLFIPLYNCSAYTRLAFEQHTNADMRGRLVEFTLTPGCLLHSYVANNNGGEILPEGNNILPQDTTVNIILHRAPGYKFNRLYVDGRRVLPSYDTIYKLGMNKAHEVYATFYRDLEIEEPEAESVYIYPNPTNGTLHVETATPQAMSLMDASGRVVATRKPENTRADIEMGALPRGVYLLKIGDRTLKVVKK